MMLEIYFDMSFELYYQRIKDKVKFKSDNKNILGLRDKFEDLDYDITIYSHGNKIYCNLRTWRQLVPVLRLVGKVVRSAGEKD
jgi:hypothetical protein